MCLLLRLAFQVSILNIVGMGRNRCSSVRLLFFKVSLVDRYLYELKKCKICHIIEYLNGLVLVVMLMVLKFGYTSEFSKEC